MLRNVIGFGMLTIGLLFIGVRQVGAQLQFRTPGKARFITLLLAPIAMATLVGSLSEVIGIQRNTAIGATVFLDTFEDGDLTNNEPVSAIDGTPVIWRPYGSSGMDVRSDKLIVSGNNDYGLIGTADWGIPELKLGDMSIRSRVRLLEGNSVVLNPVRKMESPYRIPGYFGVIEDGYARILHGGGGAQIAGGDTDFNVSQEDLMVQMDAIGDEIKLWVWRPGQDKPEEPLLSVVDTEVPTTGRGDVWVGAFGSPAKAEFHFVHVADSPITEPPSAVLSAGDADQNFFFDQLDLVQVLAAAKYLTGGPATWGEGDWNGAPGGDAGNPPPGDGVFDQLDIIAALNAGTYLQGAYYDPGEFAALSPIPEPSTMLLLALGIAGVALLRRRDQT